MYFYFVCFLFLFISCTHCLLSLTDMTCSVHDLARGKLRLSNCDIYKVLANGATLFGSQGAEYDVQDVDGIDIT